MAAELWVGHVEGDRFAIEVRGHRIEVDQPISAGGDDKAPTPVELFCASLASCVAFYAQRYLVRHGLPSEGLAVEASYDMASHPARVGRIDLQLHLPEGVPLDRRDALLAVASKCTVHNTLVTTPEVSVGIGTDVAVT